LSVEVNKVVVQRLFHQIFNQGDLEVIDEIVAKNVLGQDAAVDQTRSRESFKETVILFR